MKIFVKHFIPIFIAFFPFLLSAENASHIVISEVQITGGSGESTNEFVELYNPTDTETSLSDWQLIKKTGSGSEYVLVDNFTDVIIPAYSFFLIAHPVGYLGEVLPDLFYSTTNSIASNNTIILQDGDGNEIDKVGLGSSSDFENEAIPNPGSNKSIERKARTDSDSDTMIEGGLHYFLGNGEDSDSNISDFILRPEPEPQNSHSEIEYLDIVVPELPVDDPGTQEDDAEHENNTEHIIYSDTIRITELFPNPKGRDDHEFIEIQNFGDSPVDLEGWQLGDESSRLYTISSSDFLSTVIESGEYMVIEKEISGISLNNTSDSAMVYQPNEVLLDSVSYTDCQEAQSYSLVDETWEWTDSISPGNVNFFEIHNDLPVAIFELEKTELKVGETLVLSAADSKDADGDELEFFWDLGNGDEISGETLEYAYPAVGTFTITLRVRDEKGGEDEAEEEVEVSDYDYSDALALSEILPSCSPSDKECEFIEVFNSGKDDINLDGWQLADLKTTYSFPVESMIEVGEYYIIERPESKITLNNSGDTVFLIDPRGDIINGVEYEKAKKDASFSFDSDTKKWNWTTIVTPGGSNEFSEGEETEEGESDSETQSVETITMPVDVAIVDITEAMLDTLVRVKGEVESAKSTGIYLMDDLGNLIRIYIQKKTNIPKPDAKPGDMMEVVGIVSKTSVGLRILPRTEADIIITKAEPADSSAEGKVLGESTEQEIIELPVSGREGKIKMYLFITIGAVVLVIGGVLIKVYLKKKRGKKV